MAKYKSTFTGPIKYFVLCYCEISNIFTGPTHFLPVIS